MKGPIASATWLVWTNRQSKGSVFLKNKKIIKSHQWEFHRSKVVAGMLGTMPETLHLKKGHACKDGALGHAR
jgi:hypothetical protein